MKDKNNNKNDNSEKLQKVLARVGIASRRQCEVMISAGRIKVNNVLAKLGDRITDKDNIKIDDVLVSKHQLEHNKTRILLYHKPEHEICTRSDPENRPTVFERLPLLHKGRWIVIGRLDINTSGLLLFTTDGELANQLMHPSYEIEREYAVRIFGEVTESMLKNLRRGVDLEDGPAKFKTITFKGGEGINKWYHVVLCEGRNREVRRLWESQGVKVSRLIRVRFGNMVLPPLLRPGKFQDLSLEESESLKSLLKRSSKIQNQSRG
jgi:23S rRNA pseudouridine2605 synthase